MRFLVWLMLGGFVMFGWVCLVDGARTLVTVIRRRPYLRRAPGTVVAVHSKRETRQSGGEYPKMRTYVQFYPEIQFKTESGETIAFRSEVGESGVVGRKDGVAVNPVPGYHYGQSLDVFYDPEGKISPRIACFAGLYGPAATTLIAGVVFLGASVVIWVCFGEKLLGR